MVVGLLIEPHPVERHACIHFGAVSGPVGATVLTVYTIGGAMKLHLRGQATATTAELAAEATRAMALLSSGLESPAFVETIHH